MSIDTLVNKEEVKSREKVPSTINYKPAEQRQPYSLFVQQYLEKPITTEIEPMAFSPTACTVKGIPVIDDF